MGNVYELLVNVVSIEMPKLLIGINQKVCGWLFRWYAGTRRHTTAGGKAGPNPVV